MIVAAEKMKLQEALPILMKQFLSDGYPSPTIQAHAWSAAWRICGRADKAPNFPVLIGALEPEQIEALWAFWVDREVKTWVPLLGDEDHDKREGAQRRLVDLGRRVKAAIDRLPPSDDPEVAARLKRVREIYFVAADCKTVDEAVALLDRLNADLSRRVSADSAPMQDELVKMIEDVYARIPELAESGQADLVVANLRYKAGMEAYKQYRDSNKKSDLSQVLRRASADLEKAVAFYGKHLKANPNDKLAQDRQVECNMIEYACRKYGGFEREAAAEEEPMEAKKAPEGAAAAEQDVVPAK